MAKLADAQDLGSCGETLAGSNPASRKNRWGFPPGLTARRAGGNSLSPQFQLQDDEL